MGKTLALLAAAVVATAALSVGASYLLLSHRPAAPADGTQTGVPPLDAALKPVSLDTFTTNLADAEQHFIQVTFILVPRDDKVAARLTAAKPLLRDAVLTILRTRTAQDVRGADGMASLAAAVQTRLDELAGKGAVARVLVTDLVVQ